MRIGVIGTGVMGTAFIGGLINNPLMKPSDIIGADLFAPGRERVKNEYGIEVTDRNIEAVEKSDVIILSVKPGFYESIINEIREAVTDEKIIITLAAGITLDWMNEKFKKPVKIIIGKACYDLTQLLPVLRKLRILRTWGGQYDMTADGTQIIDFSDKAKGLVNVCGFSGRGLLVAPRTAILVARALCGEPDDIDINMFSAKRFETGDLIIEPSIV